MGKHIFRLKAMWWNEQGLYQKNMICSAVWLLYDSFYQTIYFQGFMGLHNDFYIAYYFGADCQFDFALHICYIKKQTDMILEKHYSIMLS